MQGRMEGLADNACRVPCGIRSTFFVEKKPTLKLLVRFVGVKLCITMLLYLGIRSM